jgi:hypothetical protein
VTRPVPQRVSSASAARPGSTTTPARSTGPSSARPPGPQTTSTGTTGRSGRPRLRSSERILWARFPACQTQWSSQRTTVRLPTHLVSTASTPPGVTATWSTSTSSKATRYPVDQGKDGWAATQRLRRPLLLRPQPQQPRTLTGEQEEHADTRHVAGDQHAHAEAAEGAAHVRNRHQDDRRRAGTEPGDPAAQHPAVLREEGALGLVQLLPAVGGLPLVHPSVLDRGAGPVQPLADKCARQVLRLAGTSLLPGRAASRRGWPSTLVGPSSWCLAPGTRSANDG